MNGIDIWNINRYICKVLHKNCQNYLPLNYVKVLAKVLFSDNNSDVFEWN